MTYPFSDENMIYDFNAHRYRLTPKCVLDELNVNLEQELNPTGSANIQQNVNAVLDQISFVVYQEIYSYSSQNDLQEYFLAKCPELRNVIKEAMKQQVLYFLFNGDLSVYSGVDFKKNTKSPKVSDRILSPNAYKILSNRVKSLGTSILYGGQWICSVDLDYEKLNY